MDRREIADGEAVGLLELLFVKARPWDYEREWRCVCVPGEPRLKHYAPSSLRAVYLGSEATKTTESIVRHFARAMNPDVLLFRGRRSRERFELEFDPL